LHYKQDDIKCTNFNLNVNGGLNINEIPESLRGLVESQAQTGDSEIDTGAYNTGENRFGSYDNKKDSAFICINNNDNDNEVIISPPPTPTPYEVTVDTITGLGDVPVGIAYDPVNERMYVTNQADDTVSNRYQYKYS
jgi:hypothetical protein